MEFKYSVEDMKSNVCNIQEDVKFSKFDQLLRSRWDMAMESGYFRYTLGRIETKIIPGKFKFVAQLNIKRATEKRKAAVISTIDQPFDHSKFNFNMIKDHEILFELCPHNNKKMDMNDKLVVGKDDGNSRHLIVINVSPLEYCNVLLVPSVQSCLPQVLDVKSLQLALEIMLLSSQRSFRVGWNSLCALASVNHLHFHAYYLEHELYTEYAECKHVAGRLHETTDWPITAFVLQLHGSDIMGLTKDIHVVTSYLHRHNIAHNFFLTKGKCLQRGTSERTIRAYIWPRKSYHGVKDFSVFNPAVCELAGHLPVKSEDSYKLLTEETTIQVLKSNSLTDEECDIIKTNLQVLFSNGLSTDA